ncbi:MAG: RDD family protein [Propionibacteriaceae bacterium]
MTEPPSSQPVPPPGWYRDPADPGRQRWWNGVAWSDQVRLADASAPSPGGTRPSGTHGASSPGAPASQVHVGFRPVVRPATTHVQPIVAAAAATGLASFGRRVVATIIDNLLVSFVITAVMSVVIHDFQNRVVSGMQVLYDDVLVGGQSTLPDDLSHLLMLMTYAVIVATVAYGVVCLGVWSRTLGQRVAGIAVCPVDKHADKVGWSRGLARSLAWTLLSQGGGLFLAVNAVSISMVLWHPKRQSLPDLLARTQVVRRS